MLIEIDLQCPYCNEVFPLMVDTSQGDHTTTEDCTVCCRPIQIEVSCEPGEVIDVNVSRG
jgi:hypothetical protein